MSALMTASFSPSTATPSMVRRRRLSLVPRRQIGEGTVGRVILCAESTRARSRRVSSTNANANAAVATSSSTATAAAPAKVWAVKFAERAKLHSKHTDVSMERRILQRVRHPNVVKLDWYADLGDTCAMGLEVCAGGDLFGLLYERLQGPLTEAEIAPLAAQIYKGLRALHRHNVVHRDLKAENVGLTARGEVKILDFDTAYVFESDVDTVVTHSGTLLYAAPEVLCRREARFEPDFWSFGVILYELLCACTPFERHADDQNECVRRICTVRHRFPSSIHASALTEMIDMLLEKQKELRMNAHALETHPFFAHLLNEEIPPELGAEVDTVETLAALVEGASGEVSFPAQLENSFEAMFVL